MQPVHHNQKVELRSALILTLAVAATFGMSLAGAFVWDDLPLIVDNGLVKEPAGVLRLLVSGFWETSDDHDRFRSFFRPLISLTYAADYAVWGLNPFGFHLTNVLLHLLCSWMVYRIARHENLAPGCALAGGLLFAVHPVHVESVAWISGRTDLLCAALALGAYLAYRRGLLRPDRLRIRVASWILFLAALFAKEMAATLPLLIFLDRWSHARSATHRFRQAAGSAAPFAVVLGVYGLSRLLAIGAATGLSLYTLEPQAWFSTALFVLARYATLLILPVGLDAHYPYTPIEGLGSPLALFGAAMLVVLVIAGVRLARRAPQAAFWLAWIFLGLTPVLAFGRFGDVILADRFTYLPSVGLAVLAAMGVRLIADSNRALQRRVLAVCVVVIALLLGVQSVSRTLVWRSDMALFSNMLGSSPNSALVRNNYGLALYQAGKLNESIEQFGQAVELDRSYALAHNNLGAATERAGRHLEAMRHYRNTLELAPDTMEAERNLAHLMVRLGQPAEGLARLERLVSSYPSSPDVHFALADVVYRRGEIERATTHLDRAVSIEPRHSESHYLLGKIHHEQGRAAAAAAAMSRFLELWPEEGVHTQVARRIVAAAGRPPDGDG